MALHQYQRVPGDEALLVRSVFKPGSLGCPKHTSQIKMTPRGAQPITPGTGLLSKHKALPLILSALPFTFQISLEAPKGSREMAHRVEI